MKIVIVGPGAMGCLFAALLSKSGQECRVLDHLADRAKILSENGLHVEGVSGELRVKVPVSAEPADMAQAELVLICVKSYHTREAIAALAPFLNEEARILTLQNGVGNVEALSEICGKNRVWGGITSQGATVLESGHIRHAGTGPTLIGAAAGPGQEARLNEVAEAFRLAGFPTEIEARVEPLIWSKLVINVGINPLTALTRLKNGQLLDYPGTVGLMEQSVEEALAVIRCLGIDLIYPDPLERVKTVASATAGNIASMLQDVLSQRRTEIDSINGAVVREGLRLGIPTPVNETLTHLVKTIEASYGAGV